MKVKINKVNYNIYIDEKNRSVIAVCRYAGRNVKGVAKSAPGDAFSIQFGTELAVARCELKVAKMRLQNARKKYLSASKAADEADKYYNKMKQFYIDSVDQLDTKMADVENLVKKVYN